MAYRFNGSTGYVEFGIAPFSGYTFGPGTWAAFMKQNVSGVSAYGSMSVLASAALGAKIRFQIINDALSIDDGTRVLAGPQFVNSTSIWYILAITVAATGAVPRFHVWDGTIWTHGDAVGLQVIGGNAIVGTDRHQVGIRNTNQQLSADLVCIGIKKSNSSDGAVATLSPTAFSAWTAFGFDWLVGFDASSSRTNAANPGSGDETARVNTSLVADPPGWTFAAAARGSFLPFM